MSRKHGFSKEISRRRFELKDVDDNTVFLYERGDGVTVRCTRPAGASGQFSTTPIDGLETNGSHTDYVIYINGDPVTVESSYEKAQDTVTDICISIEDYGVEDTVRAIDPQQTVIRTEINHVE